MKTIIFLLYISSIYAYEKVIPVPMAIENSVYIDIETNETQTIESGVQLLTDEMFSGPLNSTKFKEINGDDLVGDEHSMTHKCQYEDETNWCRFFKVNGIGRICPCCEPIFDPWDTVPRPDHDNNPVKFYYFKPKPNSIYVNPNSTRWMAGDHRIFTFDEKELLFVTGERCGNNGVPILLPENKLSETKATVYQELLKNILKAKYD